VARADERSHSRGGELLVLGKEVGKGYVGLGSYSGKEQQEGKPNKKEEGT